MVTLNGIDELKARVGREIGVSDWVEVTQEGVDAFAEITGDDQWIHVDPDRARNTPFGGTIAHGLYTLSLGPGFSYALMDVRGFAFGLNYGYGRVRFPTPLPVGSRVRMRLGVDAVDAIPGGVQLTTKLTFETEGGDKPVCVAESIARLHTGG